MHTKNGTPKSLLLRTIAVITCLIFIIGCNAGTPTTQNISDSGVV